MKKFLSLFLAIVMVFAIAIPVFAEGDDCFEIEGKGTYATLTEALDAAADGDTIKMLDDFTMSFNAQQPVVITKSVTIDGNGLNLEFVSEAANQFAVNVNAEGKTVTIKNFENITATVGGGIAVSAGTLNLEDVVITSKGRAAVKTQEGKEKAINVTASTIQLDPDAGSGEATMILSGNQASTLTLNAGAIIQRNSASNNTPNAGGSVIYMLNSGNHSIIMNEGSIIWAAHKSGSSASCIGLGSGDTKGANTITINEGAFLYAAANVSKFYFFGQNGNTNTINAYDGAFMVDEDATFTLEEFVLNGSQRCSFEEIEADTGVYKMVRETITDYDFEVGSTKLIGSFGDALAKAVDGDTIKLLKDCNTAETNIGLSGKNVVVDLNSFTLNASGDGAYFMNSLKSTLTFKNGTLKVARGIIIQAGGHLVFENATAIAGDGTGSNSRPLAKLNAGTCKLTVKDSTLETKTSIGEALILSEGTSNGTINLEGKAVLKYSGDPGSNDQNHTAISNCGTATVTINVGAEASIIAAHKSSTKSGKIVTAICQDAGGTVIINLEKGATIAADRTLNSNNVTSTKFIHDKTPDTGSITVNDNGANWVVSADVAKQGIILPANPFGYKIGDTKLALEEDNVYQDFNATGTVTITAISYSFKPEMIKGAAIRLELPIALRFGATIDAESYEMILALDPNAEFGFAVAKKGSAGAKFDVASMDPSNYKLVKATSIENVDGVCTFATNIYYTGEDSILSNDRTGYKQNLSARAYIKTTINGEDVYYWADFSAVDNSRSLYTVANSYIADTVNGSTTNNVANYIVAVCDIKK